MPVAASSEIIKELVKSLNAIAKPTNISPSCSLPILNTSLKASPIDLKGLDTAVTKLSRAPPIRIKFPSASVAFLPISSSSKIVPFKKSSFVYLL